MRQGWVSSGKTLFLQNLRFTPVNSSKNQNVGIVGRYEESLFTAAAVYYLKTCKCASYQSSVVISISVRLRQKT